MIIKYKTTGIFLLLLLLLISGFYAVRVNADTKLASDSGFTYLFHLFVKNGKLIVDPAAKFKYDIITEPYAASTVESANPYRGEVVNFRDQILSVFNFDPSIVKGRLSVKGPYFADAAKVNFYDDQNHHLFMVSVGESAICNDDSVCQSDVGENSDNCSIDCKLLVAPSASPTSAGGGEGETSRPVFWMTILAIGAIIILAIWLIIKKRKTKSGTLPPPSSLPPPTALPSLSLTPNEAARARSVPLPRTGLTNK